MDLHNNRQYFLGLDHLDKDRFPINIHILTLIVEGGWLCLHFSDGYILTLIVEGGWLCLHFFQMAISQWKKGSRLFPIHFELSKNQKKVFGFFHRYSSDLVMSDIEGAGTIT